MDCSMTGFPVHHQLPELTQTHVHRAGDAIQPSHPLSSPSPVPRTVSLSPIVKQGSALRWHFQDLNPGVPISVHCPFYVTKLQPGQPQEDATPKEKCLQSFC